MTLQDYVTDYNGASNINGKPFHTYGFADSSRAKRMGATGFRPFKDRQRRELNRRIIRGYTESKVVKVPEARQELAVAQREDTEQRLERLQAKREDSGPLRAPAQNYSRPGQTK